MLRVRPAAFLRKRLPPFPSGRSFFAPRERAAVAVALFAFLLAAARRWRGWL